MKKTTGNDIKSSEIMSGEWLYGSGGMVIIDLVIALC